MATNVNILCFMVCHLILLSPGPHRRTQAHAAGGGQWAVLKPNIGISAMHMQLLKNDRVVMFDRTDFGKSEIALPGGKCRVNPNELVLKRDCTAHSVEYDVASNSIRPLMVLTDVWCSSGAVNPSGDLVQTGGFNDGEDVVRVFKPCSSCDWEEIGSGLGRSRWYATNHILPDGRQIIIGGRGEFNYEFYPKGAGSGSQVYDFPFLAETNDPGIENNLYPFVFLNVDGNLFVFANNRAILFDYLRGKVVKTYPGMPDGSPRSYPSTGSAVLLPLTNLQGPKIQAEVLVCGGAPKGSYTSARRRRFEGALNTCGRIKITDPSPKWVMETMPMGRVMGDMLLLPNGEVLIINGGSAGTAGWEYGRDPIFKPVIYQPNKPIGSRFELQNPNSIPRMYHSTAVLLRDGRVLVGGSNPHQFYKYTNVLFPTELSLEAFSPSYLDRSFAYLRPKIISPFSQAKLQYGQSVPIRFSVAGKLNENLVTVTMVAPSFNTHSFSMNQRLLVLGSGDVKIVGKSTYQIQVTTPGSGILAPSGYYLLFVVHQEIPSEGIWVHIQ
ncbi:Aldehyde oxidase [Actinidia chinensis var. chinensis]|uniref:Aldehyde oxidase GLOX n=1 Tax=Actinidia chinensis var. chinensis TaxID=1590841 RepID=A0A2R6R041_ACTCC|nr:Aldehyde oxidase [Actinidia chinensis var. chinensis]